MASIVINTREDLDALAGTPEHAAFMTMLRGSLWRLEKDDESATWRAVEDNSTIQRLGFARSDFGAVPAPELPEYAPPTAPGADQARAAAYRAESDPLFFKWQAGEGTKDAWLEKRAEIRTREIG